MKRFFLNPWFLVPASILFFFWWAFVPSYNHWNQKLTVYIDTPQGEVVASSVVGIKYRSGVNFFEAWGGGFHFDITGEAVVANLGEGRFVFVLLKGTTALPEAAYHEEYDKYS